MGLFDKRVKSSQQDEFDGPVEQVKLHHPPTPAPRAAAPAGSAAPTAASSSDGDAQHYGIDRAIELMRRLPTDNMEIVVQVVKATLESLQVSVGSIIRDAQRKEARITARVDTLRKEITDLEGEISTRKSEIGELEADQRETAMVKERLTLAENRDHQQTAGELPPRPRRAPLPPVPAVDKSLPTSEGNKSPPRAFGAIEETLNELWLDDGKKK